MDPLFVQFLSSRGVTELEYKAASLADKNPLVEAFQSQNGKLYSYLLLSYLITPINLTSATLKLFLNVSSHISIALDNLKSLYISHLISPTRVLLSVK
jgi:hypothetical protein